MAGLFVSLSAVGYSDLLAERIVPRQATRGQLGPMNAEPDQADQDDQQVGPEHDQRHAGDRVHGPCRRSIRSGRSSPYSPTPIRTETGEGLVTTMDADSIMASNGTTTWQDCEP